MSGVHLLGSVTCPPGTIPDAAGTCIGVAFCPGGTELDPVSMTCKKKTPILIYLAIAGILLLLVTKR